MAVALHGNLRDFGIGEVFQLIGQQRKTGVLSVRGGSGEVELRFDQGRIVSASPVGVHEQAALGEMLVRCGLLTRERLLELERERENSLLRLDRLLAERGVLPREQIEEIEDLLTRETLFDLLRWTEGSFHFVSRPIPHDRDPQALLAAEQILMDGLRMVDEWRSLAGELPPESAVLRRRGSLEDYRHARAGADPRRVAEEERVLLLVDGRLSVRRIIDLSRLGSFECARILAALQRDGWIEATAPPRSGSHEASRRDKVRTRRAFASALALAALAALAVWVHLGDPPPSPARPALAPTPLEAARVRFDTQRMRNLAEAYRFARGEWPSEPDALRRWVESRHPSLAPEERPYYYAKSEEGVLILAPEHGSTR